MRPQRSILEIGRNGILVHACQVPAQRFQSVKAQEDRKVQHVLAPCSTERRFGLRFLSHSQSVRLPPPRGPKAPSPFCMYYVLFDITFA